MTEIFAIYKPDGNRSNPANEFHSTPNEDKVKLAVEKNNGGAVSHTVAPGSRSFRR